MRALVVLPLLSLAACAQVRPAAVDDYAHVTRWAAGRAEVTLRFREGRAPVRARDLHLAPDTSWFLNPQRGTVERVATSGIARVEAVSTARGQRLGLVVGGAGGLAVGGLMALPVNSASGDWTIGTKVGVAAALGAVGGALGYAVGQRTGAVEGFTLR